MVLLKVSHWKGIICFRKQGKLGPGFIGTFKVVARVNNVAYRLDLPDDLIQIHNTVHVSQLRKYIVEDTVVVSLDDILVDEHLNYVERSVVILDRLKKTLQNNVAPLVNVQ